MDYKMHTSTKCWVTIPGIMSEADMNVDALHEIVRYSIGEPDITLYIAFRECEPETMTFKGLAGKLECINFIKSNMHNAITLKVQDIRQVSAVLVFNTH
jgi:hypothetical protein